MSRYYIDLAPAKDTPPFLARRDLACRDPDVNPEWFYPGRGGGRPVKALGVCDRCPAKDDCREWAIGTGQAFGVWGGTTDEDRRQLAGEAAA